MEEKELKEIYYKLDDIGDLQCQLDLMLNGYVSYIEKGVINKKLGEQVLDKSLDLQEAISELKNQFKPNDK